MIYKYFYRMKQPGFLLIFSIILFSLFSLQGYSQTKKEQKIGREIEKKLSVNPRSFSKWKNLGKIELDSVFVDKKGKTIKLFYNNILSYLPYRENIVDDIYKQLKKKLGWWYRKYRLEVYSQNKKISEYVPNYFRRKIPVDSTRFVNNTSTANPIISRFYPLYPKGGLFNNNIAIWHSHGRYYEAKLDRWEWQRARLHSTVEDIFPMTFVLDYLEPMLENAGATVFIPRERDINTEEYIVDNDYINYDKFISYENIDTESVQSVPGFMYKDTFYNNENPFKLGTSLILTPEKNKTGIVTIIPEIKKMGKYAVYISYGKSENTKVKYSIIYSGGKKEYIVDQTQGQGTWIYLGKFFFRKSDDNSKSIIQLSSDKPFNLDAVKIGGGMGNIARRPSSEITPKEWSLKGQKKPFQNDNEEKVKPDNFLWKISGMPRYLEAARYFLQYSGMPDSIVYSLSGGKNDYNDDYQSRGEWVDYLMGKPNGPTGHQDVKGLGIPIDLALAFHTDAGVAEEDSIIGTLAIYSSDTPDSVFPSGQSKMVNRDLVDIVQTQIVNDIRYLDNPKWSRRGIWNKPYSEAWRANTPMMLLELLSHQNLADMSYGLDHRFKFDVSRAIYKGMLKFLAYQNHKDYVVQPLPVSHFSIEIIKGKRINLSWKAVEDPLEPTAIPDGYMVYQREQNNGFDSGKLVKETTVEMELPDYNKIYSFKITAVNSGGESFPSEILSVAIKDSLSPVALVVNAFERISGPAIIDLPGLSGVSYWRDMGVPYVHEIGLTGKPYEFDRNDKWKDDDSPGWGASFADWEGKIISGNTFDYPYVHGYSILKAGYSFTSTGEKAFVKNEFDIKPYNFIDIIFGEERTTKSLNHSDFTVFTPNMISKIKEVIKHNGNLFVSGAYIGTDFKENKDTIAEKFAKEYLHFKWLTNYASKTGLAYSTDYAKNYFSNLFSINTSLNKQIYQVEAPDGITPADNNTVTAFRYKDTGISAGTIYKDKYKVVALGFPFETILSAKNRDLLMKQIIEFFENQK